MTRIGVIGAGIAGLHLGLALRAHDVEVAIYTDRSAAEVAAGPLLNTVAHHHHTLERERALGVCHWEAGDHGYGCHHHCVVGAGPVPVRFRGDFEHPSVVIDHRLYLPRLMADFEERGGELVVAAVTADALPRLAREHDLLVIATGRAGLATLFGRRADKSPYEAPQRRLSAGIYHGIAYPQPTGVGVPVSAIVDDYGFDERFARRVARDREAVVLGVSDWTNMTLSPPPQMVELLFAMASSKPLCDAFSRNFNHPDRQADALATPERTAAFIARWNEAG